MSSLYGITDTGFIIKDYSTILNELQTEAIRLFGPNTDTRKTNPLMTLLNIMAAREQELWSILAETYNNSFPISATSVALQLHGNDRGVIKKEATTARGVVNVVGDPGTTIGLNTLFSTIGTNVVTFKSIQNVTVGNTIEQFTANLVDGDSIPYTITLSNKSSNVISVSVNGLNYTMVSSVDDIVADTYYVDYGETETIVSLYTKGNTFVTYINDDIGTADIEVESTVVGEFNNVSALLVNNIVTPILGLSSVTNDSPILGGSDEESDEVYRQRVVSSSKDRWSVDDLISELSNISEIKSVDIDVGIREETFSYNDELSDYDVYTGKVLNLQDVTFTIFRVRHYSNNNDTYTEYYNNNIIPEQGDYKLVQNTDDDKSFIVVNPNNNVDDNDLFLVQYMDRRVGAGVFNLIVNPNSPPISEELRGEIINILKTDKLFGLSYNIIEPIYSYIDIKISVLLEGGYELGSIDEDIKNTISEYLTSLNTNKTLYNNRIIDLVMSIEGLVDITKIEYTTINEELVRGIDGTQNDQLINSPISLPSTLTIDGITYNNGSDYYITDNSIHWEGVNVPPSNTIYTLTYGLLDGANILAKENVIFSEGVITVEIV